MLILGWVLGSAPTWGERPNEDPLEAFKIGRWIELQGTARDVSPASCTQLKLLTGDFLDDDWSLQGTVTSVDSVLRQLTIGKCVVQITDRTIFEIAGGGMGDFSDLRKGSFLDVEGTFARGMLVAEEIDDETAKVSRKRRNNNQIEIVGKLDGVDLKQRVISVLGMEFQVGAHTRIRSVIR